MLNVYLSGEIHTDWRDEIIKLCEKEDLSIKFSSPNTNHELSDNCGVEILGAEENNFWKDKKGASINSIKTKKTQQTQYVETDEHPFQTNEISNRGMNDIL